MEKIKSEEPELHWGFLNINDKVVLDLGCGKFYSSISTAEWFLNKGASRVIGIDLGTKLVDDDRFIYHTLNIDSTEKLKDLIKTYKPEIIKSDIEGAEKFFDGISKTIMSSVKEFAVEYHDAETKEICEQKLKDWGFKQTKLYGLFEENIERIGVIHAIK